MLKTYKRFGLCFLHILVLFVFNLSYANINLSTNKIIEIHKISEVKTYVTKNSLVLFDIDNTLLTSSQSLGSDQWFEYMVKSQLSDGDDEKEAIKYALDTWQVVHESTDVVAIENDTTAVIQQIQRQSPFVFALTARDGKLFEISERELSSIGVAFNTNSKVSSIPDLTLDPSNSARYKQGIISAGLTGKGHTIKEFLAQSGIDKSKIDRIIFIDDKKHNVEDVAQAISSLNIDFIGLRYGHADQKVKDFSAHVADKQLSIMQKCGKIISDNFAKIVKFTGCEKLFPVT